MHFTQVEQLTVQLCGRVEAALVEHKTTLQDWYQGHARMAGQYLARPSEQDDWLAESAMQTDTIQEFPMDSSAVSCSLLTMIGSGPRKSPLIRRLRPKSARRRLVRDSYQPGTRMALA